MLTRALWRGFPASLAAIVLLAGCGTDLTSFDPTDPVPADSENIESGDGRPDDSPSEGGLSDPTPSTPDDPDSPGPQDAEPLPAPGPDRTDPDAPAPAPTIPPVAPGDPKTPTEPPAQEPPADPPSKPPFAASASSIRTQSGGPRMDPEGVAPPADDTTLLTWRDSRGRERTMTLGAYLYQYDFTFHDGLQEYSRSANDDAWGHEGFGYVVSHNTLNGNSPLGKANAPTKVETVIFAGAHHAVHRIEMLYDRDKERGGYGIKIPVVIEWMVATGRDHPVWAVNWKTGEAINPNNVDFDVYRMDTRGPYGSLNFDGAGSRNEGDAIGNVAWGDFGLRFATLDGLLTLQSSWSYNQPNRVPFVYASTASANAEMGIVRTLPGDKQMGMADRVYGRERGATSAMVYPGWGDCLGFGDPRVYVMPCVNGWPYQLMNYDWDAGAAKPVNEPTGTKLMAWGTPYGWLGASSFNVFDFSETADGRGDRCYATFIVLGPRGRFTPEPLAFDQPGDVSLVLDQVESLADATITDVSLGALVTEAPRGPLSDQARPIVNGYDDTYAVYRLRAGDAGLAFTFTPGAAAVTSPVFVIENYAARHLPSIMLDGEAVFVNADVDADVYASLDQAGDRLWVTLNRTVDGPAVIRIMP